MTGALGDAVARGAEADEADQPAAPVEQRSAGVTPAAAAGEGEAGLRRGDDPHRGGVAPAHEAVAILAEADDHRLRTLSGGRTDVADRQRRRRRRLVEDQERQIPAAEVLRTPPSVRLRDRYLADLYPVEVGVPNAGAEPDPYRCRGVRHRLAGVLDAVARGRHHPAGDQCAAAERRTPLDPDHGHRVQLGCAQLHRRRRGGRAAAGDGRAEGDRRGHHEPPRRRRPAHGNWPRNHEIQPAYSGVSRTSRSQRVTLAHEEAVAVPPQVHWMSCAV